MAADDDLTARGDDAALSERWHALFVPAFRGADHVTAVLVRPGLHHEPIVEALERILAWVGRVVLRRVVTDQDQLGTVQREHPVGLRPAAVVTGGHPDNAAERVPRIERIAGFEVAAFEMLELPPRLMFTMTGQMDLVVRADDRTVAFNKDLGVEATPIGGELGVPEAEPHLEFGGTREKALGLGPGHLGLVERVEIELGIALDVPAGEEGRECEFWEGDQFGTLAVGLLKKTDQTVDDRFAWFVAADRAELPGGDDEASRWWRLVGAPRCSVGIQRGCAHVAANSSMTWSRTLAPASRSVGLVYSAGL